MQNFRTIGLEVSSGNMCEVVTYWGDLFCPSIFGFFYGPSAHTPAWIFTIYTSNDVFPHKVMPFGGHFDVF